MLIKCPKCGHFIPECQYGNERNEIADILFKMPKRIKELLTKVSFEIRCAIPSEDNIKVMYKFITKMKNCDNESIIKTIELFLIKELHKDGKGFSYLSAMIVNYDANKDKLKKYEQLKIGSSPPKKEIR